MKYTGKLYGKVGNLYIPIEANTDDWEALEKRVAKLESENRALRQPPINNSFCDLYKKKYMGRVCSVTPYPEKCEHLNQAVL